ncbi:MAG TPA: hypothetical protein VLF40_03985 [Candidatus Saccharimonadales bacterium]|nr:hypothetical protein [Candidatus Saccharimonadales bacterium]
MFETSSSGAGQEYDSYEPVDDTRFSGDAKEDSPAEYGETGGGHEAGRPNVARTIGTLGTSEAWEDREDARIAAAQEQAKQAEKEKEAALAAEAEAAADEPEAADATSTAEVEAAGDQPAPVVVTAETDAPTVAEEEQSTAEAAEPDDAAVQVTILPVEVPVEPASPSIDIPQADQDAGGEIEPAAPTRITEVLPVTEGPAKTADTAEAVPEIPPVAAEPVRPSAEASPPAEAELTPETDSTEAPATGQAEHATPEFSDTKPSDIPEVAPAERPITTEGTAETREAEPPTAAPTGTALPDIEVPSVPRPEVDAAAEQEPVQPGADVPGPAREVPRQAPRESPARDTSRLALAVARKAWTYAEVAARRVTPSPSVRRVGGGIFSMIFGGVRLPFWMAKVEVAKGGIKKVGHGKYQITVTTTEKDENGQPIGSKIIHTHGSGLMLAKFRARAQYAIARYDRHIRVKNRVKTIGGSHARPRFFRF